jgi:HIP---CoA ligase
MLPNTLPGLIEYCAEHYADRIAIQDGDVRLSYAQLNQARLQAAKAVIAAGLTHGDCAAIWAPNIYEWIVAAIGMQSVGVILVPLNNRLQSVEATDILERSRARLLFTYPELEKGSPLAMLAHQALPQLVTKVVFRGQATDQGSSSWSDFLGLAEQVDDQTLQQRIDAVKPDDIMDMLFTSGTTGKPKGVLCNHSQNIRVFQTWADTVGLVAQDHYLIVNPFFHSFGYKAGWLAALIKGCKILPAIAFDKKAIMEQIERDRVTVLPGAPAMYQMILSTPNFSDYDLSSLRLGVTGAAPISVQQVNDMWNTLGFETVVTAYGLTESTGVISICRPDDNAETISNTSGCAIEGVEVKCVNPATGIEVPRGSDGEIWVRGYNVMQGYFDMPEATAETINEEGWMKTGDIGVMDERGYLRITDRLKDMYILNGENVYPAEIEKLLQQLDAVAQVAVIGVPKPPQGEVGMAFIVTSPGASLEKEAVIAHCNERLARYKVPYYVEFIDQLPANAMGKVVKPELKTLAKTLLA